MHKLTIVVLFALVAIASAGIVAPLVSGVSHTQRIQSHVPLGVVGVGVPLVGKGVGLGGVGLVGGYGVGGLGLGVGGLGLGGLGVIG